MRTLVLTKTFCKSLILRARMRSLHVIDVQVNLFSVSASALRSFAPGSHTSVSSSFQEHVCIGAYTFVGDAGLFYPGVVIGKYCSVARDVTIGAWDHPADRLSTNQWLNAATVHDWREQLSAGGRTLIDNDVWIGTGVVVKAGIHIGTGAIVGANAVVTHDVPPYAIVTGVPARIIRHRFQDDVIRRLLDSRWWDLPYDVLCGLPKDVERFLSRVEIMGSSASRSCLEP